MREMDRTLLAVKRRARRLRVRFAMRGLGGVHRGRVVRNWTKAEDNELAMMLGTLSHARIARQLGRSRQAVNNRASILGLDCKQGTLTVLEASRRLGVSWATVRNYGDKLGRRWCKGNGADPGLDLMDLADVAQAILDEPKSQVKVRAPRLRQIAEGDLLT